MSIAPPATGSASVDSTRRKGELEAEQSRSRDAYIYLSSAMVSKTFGKLLCDQKSRLFCIIVTG